MNKTTINITFFYIHKVTFLFQKEIVKMKYLWFFYTHFPFPDANSKFILFDMQEITSL